ncbi:MAG TPA: TIGR02281 family clan AA aspartic protease [Stellaceae bacterium]|nr:TIGR02281 family clan AA aspartic protease [Stellaceae bacterium]
MTTAMDRERVKAEVGTGRMMRFTVRVAAGVLALTGIVAWFAVSHTPAPAGPTAARTSAAGSGDLFYHASHEMSFHRGGDGLYRVDAEINERQIRFVVDTGVPAVMLSPDDARAAGIDIDKLNFSARAVTPSGEMRVASVIIPMMTLNQLTLFNVTGVVTDGPLPASVLGAGFLKRFDSYDMREGELVLRW